MASQSLVLIVSSDPREQRVLAVSLRKAGLEVRAVGDGRAALAALEESPAAYGVAIIELNIEGIDGFELCERIREDGRYDALALIALTGSRDLATKLRAFEMGFDELMPKPVYVKELGTRVELLMQRRTREQLAEAEAEEIEGALAEVPVVDLVQTIEGRARTALVRLEHDDRLGELFFAEGELIDAETGGLRGEAALYRLMRWTQGYYTIKYLPALRRRRRIKRPTQSVIADGLERVERYNDLAERMPMHGRFFEVDYHALGGELDTMPATVRTVLALFDGQRDLDGVVLHAPVADLEVLRLAERLLERGQLVELDAASRVVPAADDDDEIERSHEIRAWLGDTDTASHDHEPTPSWARPERSPVASAARAAAGEGLNAERVRLDEDQRRLRDEQTLVLAAIARNEAEAARAQEDRARRDIEARQRRTPAPGTGAAESAPALVSALAGARPLAALEPAAEPTTRPTPQSIREQVVSALAEADIAYRESRPAATNGSATNGSASHAAQPRAVAELGTAWEARVQQHVGRYEVVSTHHDLRPMTLVGLPEDEDGHDPRSAALRRLESLGVHPLDEPGADDTDARADVVRGPSQLAAAASASEASDRPRAVRESRPAVEVVTPAAVGGAERAAAAPAASTARPSSDADLRQTLPGIRSARLAAEARNGAAGAAATEGMVTPAEPSSPVASASKSTAESSSPVASASKSAAEASSPVASASKSTAEPEPEAAAPAAEPVSPAAASFDDDDAFFRAEAPAAAPGGSRRLAAVIVVLLGVIVIGSVVLVLKQGEATNTAEGAGASVSARGSESETGGEAESAAPETAAPEVAASAAEPAISPAVLDDPTLSPGYIDAEAQADMVAEVVVEQAELAAAGLAGAAPAVAPAEPGPAQPPEPEPVVAKKADPPPVAEPKPEKKAAEPKPEKAPAEPKPEKKVASADDAPKPEKSVKIEKTAGKGAFADGEAAYKKKKYSDAIKHLEQAIAQDAGNNDAHFMLGLSYARTRQYPLALKHLEKVRSARSGSASYWKELGSVYLALKKDTQGIEAYEKAVELLGADHADAKKMQAYIDSKR